MENEPHEGLYESVSSHMSPISDFTRLQNAIRGSFRTLHACILENDQPPHTRWRHPLSIPIKSVDRPRPLPRIRGGRHGRSFFLGGGALCFFRSTPPTAYRSPAKTASKPLPRRCIHNIGSFHTTKRSDGRRDFHSLCLRIFLFPEYQRSAGHLEELFSPAHLVEAYHIRANHHQPG